MMDSATGNLPLRGPGCQGAAMRRGIVLLWVLLALISGGTPSSAQPRAHVDVLTVSGAIDTWVGAYVRRGIHLAEQDGAEAALILLNTPGGTLKAMQDVTTAILSARVPVVVFVYPSGAWAGSAGTFVTLAANVAAMAPGTAIGAAHPVDASGENVATDERSKVTNFSISAIQSIAEQRGHNAEWAARAVSESIAATAQEALELHVVDLVANDIEALLSQMDGRTVTTAAGEHTLRTRGAIATYRDMNASETFFHALVDPNVALVLLSIGLLAISVELYNPGSIFPGATGAISLILALVSLGNLAVNWGAVILIVLAVICFILDIKVSGFGLTIAGLVMFILGGLMLFMPLTPPVWTAPRVSTSPVVVLSLAGVMGAVFIFVLGAAVRSRRAPVLSGREALIGLTGVAVSDLTPLGQVRAKGELWTALAVDETILKGTPVRIVGIEGLRLRVVKGEQEDARASQL